MAAGPGGPGCPKTRPVWVEPIQVWFSGSGVCCGAAGMVAKIHKSWWAIFFWISKFTSCNFECLFKGALKKVPDFWMKHFRVSQQTYLGFSREIGNFQKKKLRGQMPAASAPAWCGFVQCQGRLGRMGSVAGPGVGQHRIRLCTVFWARCHDRQRSGVGLGERCLFSCCFWNCVCLSISCPFCFCARCSSSWRSAFSAAVLGFPGESQPRSIAIGFCHAWSNERI